MQAEDDNDVQAANLARAEQVAEMAEFDENFSSQISLNSKEVTPAYHVCDSLVISLKSVISSGKVPNNPQWLISLCPISETLFKSVTYMYM